MLNIISIIITESLSPLCKDNKDYILIDLNTPQPDKNKYTKYANHIIYSKFVHNVAMKKKSAVLANI